MTKCLPDVRLWGLGILLLGFILVGPPLTFAARDKSEELEALQAAEQEERRILKELDGLERQIGGIEDRLAAIEREIVQTGRRLNQGDKDIRDLDRRIGELKKYLRRRLKAIYRLPDSGLLQVMLEADSLPDLIKRYRYLSLILARDEMTLTEFSQKTGEVKVRQAALKAEQSRLYQFRLEVAAQRDKLDEARRKKTGLLMQVHQRKELYIALLKAREESQEKLIKEVIIEPIDREQRISADRAPAPAPKPETAGRKWPDFPALKGRLPRPVPGEIAGRFGKSTGPFNVTYTRTGVIFLASPGGEVKAVLEGEVIYVGWLRGYGNIVIINHGQRYYTLIGGLAGPRPKPGDWVRQGESLGQAPQAGGEDKKEIYFEIRHGGQALDPAAWLGDKAA
ncbi:MAG: peptidoglycan DD-metalloendopeptidase family protein [Thermodesulfobacteriota bacterium]